MILNPYSDHSLEQSQAALALKDTGYTSEKYAHDRLSEVESSPEGTPVHPTHDADGEVWVYPTPEEIDGSQALRRVVDKMYVFSILAITLQFID